MLYPVVYHSFWLISSCLHWAINKGLKIPANLHNMQYTSLQCCRNDFWNTSPFATIWFHWFRFARHFHNSNSNIRKQKIHDPLKIINANYVQGWQGVFGACIILLNSWTNANAFEVNCVPFLKILGYKICIFSVCFLA